MGIQWLVHTPLFRVQTRTSMHSYYRSMVQTTLRRPTLTLWTLIACISALTLFYIDPDRRFLGHPTLSYFNLRFWPISIRLTKHYGSDSLGINFVQLLRSFSINYGLIGVFDEEVSNIFRNFTTLCRNHADYSLIPAFINECEVFENGHQSRP